MTSVEYEKSVSALKESLHACESQRLRLQEEIKESPTLLKADSLCEYYRDLCQRESRMLGRARQLLQDVGRVDASLQALSRRTHQLRNRRDELLRLRAPQWQGSATTGLSQQHAAQYFIQASPQSTPQPIVQASAQNTPQPLVQTPAQNTPQPLVQTPAQNTPQPLVQASVQSAPQPLVQAAAQSAPQHLAQQGVVPPLNLSQLGSTSTTGQWKNSQDLLGLTESTLDSTGATAVVSQKEMKNRHLGDTPQLDNQQENQQHEQQRNEQQKQKQQQLQASLTQSGLFCTLEFVEASLDTAGNRVYAGSPPPPEMCADLCAAANEGRLPAYASASAVSQLALDELQLLIANLPSGCVLPDSTLRRLLGTETMQVEHQIGLSMDAQTQPLWHRLLRHMRRLARQRGPRATSALFAPLLLAPKSELEPDLIELLTDVLRQPSTGEMDEEGEEDEESVTIASEKRPPVQESLKATAGSFMDDSDPEDNDNVDGTNDEAGLHVTVNPDLRASASDAQLREYAAALEDASDDEREEENDEDSELPGSTTIKSNLPNRFSSNTGLEQAGSQLRGTSEYQKLLSASGGAAAIRTGVDEDDEDMELPTAQTGGQRIWSSAHILRSVNKDSDLDTDSELETSFRGRLMSPKTVDNREQHKPLAETEDDDFGDFYD